MKPMSIYTALFPLFFLIGILFINVLIFEGNTLNGPNQIALFISGAFALIIGYFHKVPFKKILEKIRENIASTTEAIFILLLIGALSGTWLISGIIPAMIYYGLQILHPSIFLFASCIICAIVSLCTGSSWSTVATIGLALMGIGKVLGFSEGMIAGVIISGAYFGDKISPMSDTTNLASLISRVNVLTHIRYMLITTIPSFSIACIVFVILGLMNTQQAEPLFVKSIETSLIKIFNINGFAFITPLFLIILIYKKINTLVVLIVGALMGLTHAIIFQPNIFYILVNKGTILTFFDYYKISIEVMTMPTELPIDNLILKKLLVSSGMQGMLPTIWLIIAAMFFGGIMEAMGALKKIAEVMLSLSNSIFSLFAATSGTCIVFNITTSDQYMSIVIPGKMYVDIFEKKGLAPENLSRTLEDSATVTSVLIPWNTCGAVQSRVLNVPVESYIPYAVFNYVSPFVTLLVAYFKIKIKKRKPSTNLA